MNTETQYDHDDGAQARQALQESMDLRDQGHADA